MSSIGRWLGLEARCVGQLLLVKTAYSLHLSRSLSIHMTWGNVCLPGGGNQLFTISDSMKKNLALFFNIGNGRLCVTPSPILFLSADPTVVHGILLSFHSGYLPIQMGITGLDGQVTRRMEALKRVRS